MFMSVEVQHTFAEHVCALETSRDIDMQLRAFTNTLLKENNLVVAAYCHMAPWWNGRFGMT